MAVQQRETAKTIQRRKTYRRGLAGEWRAAWFLRSRGFVILEKRARNACGEIDIVARRGRLVVFVEVKVRRHLEEALLSVTARQRARIVAAATAWLACRDDLEGCDFRFDVIVMTPGGMPHRLCNAFTTDGF